MNKIHHYIFSTTNLLILRVYAPLCKIKYQTVSFCHCQVKKQAKIKNKYNFLNINNISSKNLSNHCTLSEENQAFYRILLAVYVGVQMLYIMLSVYLSIIMLSITIYRFVVYNT